MAWTERQEAMLEAMGIRLWQPPQAVAVAEPVPAPAPETVEPAAPAPPAARDRAVGVDAMGWDALREAVVACRACKLCEGRRQTVFGVGNTSAHWMIVGEAPGEQEDRQGEPFVGKSGQLLDNMLRAIGLTRMGETALHTGDLATAIGLFDGLIYGDSEENVCFGVAVKAFLRTAGTVILTAAMFGTVIPLLMDRLKVDPALATGPFVTTLNDIFGLLTYFSVGHLMYGMLS